MQAYLLQPQELFCLSVEQFVQSLRFFRRQILQMVFGNSLRLLHAGLAPAAEPKRSEPNRNNEACRKHDACQQVRRYSPQKKRLHGDRYVTGGFEGGLLFRYLDAGKELPPRRCVIPASLLILISVTSSERRDSFTGNDPILVIDFGTLLTDMQMTLQFSPFTRSQRSRIRQGTKLLKSLVLVNHGSLLPKPLNKCTSPQLFQSTIKVVADIPQWLVEVLGNLT